LLEGVDLVLLCAQEVEESNDCTFEFSTLLRADRDGREGLPEDDLADVGGDEERDAGSEAVTLLEEFVKEDDNDSGKGELEDNKCTVQGTDLVDWTVHA